MVVHIVSMVF